jgi:cation diffusion facilitator family transporter
MNHGTEKLGAATFSIIANIFLMTIKVAVAILTGSLGIFAEFMHSLLDLLASIFAYLGIKKADEPADETHHYGHDKFENVSSLIQMLLIAITSFVIFWVAGGKLLAGGHEVKESWLGIVVLIVTLGVDFLIARFLAEKGKKTHSTALESDSMHFSTDLYSTAAALTGVIFASFGFPIMDAIAALVIAAIMLWLSIKMSFSAFAVIIDTAPDKKVLAQLKEDIRNYPGVMDYHSLRARVAGKKLFIDLCVHLDPNLNLTQAHAISEGLKKELKKKEDVKEVVIHIEPFIPNHE